jgi:hypothetical protein
LKAAFNVTVELLSGLRRGERVCYKVADIARIYSNTSCKHAPLGGGA